MSSAAPPYTPADLITALQELGTISAEQLQHAVKKSTESGEPLDKVFVEDGLIADYQIGQIISDILDIPFVQLRQNSIDRGFLLTLPEEYALKHRVLLYQHTATEAFVASPNPRIAASVVPFISRKINLPVKVFYVTERDFEHTMRLYKGDLQKSYDDLLKEQLTSANQEDAGANQAPIEKIVNLLIEYAYSNGASDIHIDPSDDVSTVRFRIDGEMTDVLQLPISVHEHVILRIKILGKLRTDEHLSAQDGKMRYSAKNEDIDIRVSIVPVVHGENCVMRLLASHYRQFTLSDLGMSATDYDRVERGFKKPHGMVLSTGPTGSGKTTTIYAILKILNTRSRNIATIEDPVEYELEGVSQIQVNQQTNLTFAEGLRSILRQDPDIIYVGEIRDNDTASIGMNSALTGHLVLSTLHTNDAATALPRFTEMGVEPFLVASTVNVVIAQRLIKKVCDNCKVSVSLPRTELETYFSPELVDKYFEKGKDVLTYQGKGCPVCHQTGYRGRVGLFEVLEVSEPIRKLFMDKADADSIKQQAVKDGMTTIMEDGLSKVQQGVTSLEEVLRASKS